MIIFIEHRLVALGAPLFFVHAKKLNNLHVLKPINKFNCTIECCFFFVFAATLFFEFTIESYLIFLVLFLFIYFFVRIFPLQNI